MRRMRGYTERLLPAVISSRSSTVFSILAAVSVGHLLNDLIQSLLPAVYPLLKSEFGLDFWHIGLITLTNQLTASLLQPVVGHFTDRRPKPYSLAIGMTSTLFGLLMLAAAPRFAFIVPAAALIGIGSAGVPPGAARGGRLAARGPAGLSQAPVPTRGDPRAPPRP